MLIPNDFYYTEKIGDEYTLEAPGSLNVSRLVKGQKAWLQPQGQAVKKRKKLFFTDSTAKTWNQYKTDVLIAALKNLINEGFELYLKQGNEFIALSDVNLDAILDGYHFRIFKIEKDPAGHFAEIVSNKLKIPMDQIQLLDEYWVNIICDEAIVQECNEGKYPKRQHALLYADNIVEEYRDGRNELVQVEFNESMEKEVSVNTDVPITVDIKSIYLDGNNDYKLITKQKGIVTNRGFVPIDTLATQISKLVCEDIDVENIFSMLRILPNLRELEFDFDVVNLRDKHIDDATRFNPDNFLNDDKIDINKLYSLNLSMAYTTAILQTHKVILAKARNLKCLSLWGYDKGEFDVVLDHLPSSIKKLVLKECQITINDFNRILQKCPSIQTVMLEEVDILEWPSAKDTYTHFVNLKHLKADCIGDAECRNQLLIYWLANSQQLQTLSLCGLKLDDKDLDYINSANRKTVPSLTYLALDQSNCNLNSLIAFCSLFPNLNHLDLDEKSVDELIKYDGKDWEKILKSRLPNLKLFYTSSISDKLDEHDLEEIPDEMEVVRELDLQEIYQDNKILANSLLIKPTDPNFQFKFTGREKSINQTMIIEKLSQFLTIKGSYLKILPKLNRGMCAVLADLFLIQPEIKWNSMVQDIAAWNGQQDTLNDNLTKIFKYLIDQYLNTYYKGIRSPKFYAGDEVVDLVVKARMTTTLSDNWHRVSVKYISDNQWQYYDPNNSKGFITVDSKTLKKCVRNSLGPVVFLKTIPDDIFPVIADKNAFIRNGGLMALWRADNCAQFFHQLPQAKQLSIQDYAGLLLRNLEGIPAWVVALHHNPDVSAYTLDLLCHFTTYHQPEAFDHLIESIRYMTGTAKFYLIEKLLELSRADIKNYEFANVYQFVDGVLERFHAEYQQAALDTAFTTWNTETKQEESVTEFLQRMRRHQGGKHLIECTSVNDVNALVTALQLTLQRPVFYIHSSDDLICYGTRIIRDGENGRLITGYGGAFYDFLKEDHSDNPPVIIINYANFKADEVVKFNTILDAKREIDHYPIPENVSIIAINNTNKPDCYKGSDFYSRFDSIERCAFNSTQLANTASLPSIFDDIQTPDIVINLFHEYDWKERLLGKWILQGDQLCFQEGELIAAFKNQYTVDIRNGLWEDEEFKLFWNQAKINGYIVHEGQIFHIPHSFKLTKSEGYSADLNQYCTMIQQFPNGPVEILNPTLLCNYFVSYRCDEQNQLLTQPGIIKRNARSNLSIFISNELSPDQWAMLLTECHQYNVKLNCFKPTSDVVNYNNIQLQSTSVVQTNDVNASVELLKSQLENPIILNISECVASDLLVKLDGRLINGVRFEFNENQRALLTALNAGTNVILKGTFSQRLTESLAPLMINRIRLGAQPSKLICVTEDASAFNFMTVMKHNVTKDDLVSLLGSQAKPLIAQYPKDDFTKLSARLRHQKAVPQNTDPWQGVYQLQNITDSIKCDFDNYQMIADAFDRNRCQLIDSVLMHHRYVLVTGLTGVGKTTSIEKFYITNDERKLFIGKDNIAAWALDKSNKRKYLFLDEANMAGMNWTQFDGTGILVDGQYIGLTNQHQIIFACNPVSYGGERNLPSLFEKHGSAVVFTPMPNEYIYANILLPVLQNSALKEYAQKISDVILQYYQFFCENSQGEILISPRELQMIALLVISHYDRNPKCNIKEMTEHYSRQITLSLVPANLLEKFDEEFPALEPVKFASKVRVHDPRFTVTESREPIAQYLSDLLTLREQRRSNRNMNNAQRFGGLGGVILEGDPGVGKSELVFNILLARGYREGSLAKDEAGDKIFYKIPANFQAPEKRRLLLKAFHEGAAVIMDEVNSSPMLEELLNDLLMGKAPGGQCAQRPGFTFFGTQNPMTQKGRIKLTSAITHRVSVIHVTQYKKNELIEILKRYGLTHRKAANITSAFIKQFNLAQQHGYKPAPTFRNLLRTADKIIKSWRHELEAIASMIDRKNPDFFMVDEMLKHYFDKLPEERGQLLMSLLRGYNYTMACRLLKLTIDIDINRVDERGWSPLHYAANSGDIELVNAVLKYKPNVNAVTQGFDKWTAIQIAVDENFDDIVDTLAQVPGIIMDSKTRDAVTNLSMFKNQVNPHNKRTKVHDENDADDNDNDIDMHNNKPF